MAFALVVVSFSLMLTLGSAKYYPEFGDVYGNVVWPKSYNYKAEKINVLRGSVEKYEVWRSSEHYRSRISYYDGAKEKYIEDETEESSAVVTVVYTKTNKKLKNFLACDEKYDEEAKTDYFPDLNGLSSKEKITLDGRPVQVWRVERVVPDKYKIQKKLYVYRSELGFDVPLKSVHKAYSMIKGDLAMYEIINFNSLRYNVSLEDVTVPAGLKCVHEGVLGQNLKTDLKYLEPHLPGDVDTAFRSYNHYHNKTYEMEEHELRKMIFHKNWMLVSEHNRKNLGYKLELNQFADYTDEEFMMMTGTRPSGDNDEETIPMDMEMLEVDLPESYDLRLDGHMRPVRSQGHCGSCWAFATAAVVEGALSVAKDGRNLDLSEQSIVDCAWGYYNHGCSGGKLSRAMQYVAHHGIPTEYEYGLYRQIDSVCHVQNMTRLFKIKGFSKVTPGKPVAMKAALLKYGPVGVGVYSGSKMKLYSSGIYYDFDCYKEKINHAVVVVGYGERDGTPYWIIRNSWGERWGEDGYMLMSAVNNNCHVLDRPYYVVV